MERSGANDNSLLMFPRRRSDSDEAREPYKCGGHIYVWSMEGMNGEGWEWVVPPMVRVPTRTIMTGGIDTVLGKKKKKKNHNAE